MKLVAEGVSFAEGFTSSRKEPKEFKKRTQAESAFQMTGRGFCFGERLLVRCRAG